MRRQKFRISLCMFALLIVYLQGGNPKTGTITVTAAGEAAGGAGAKEKSKENALRNAVEKGFGVYIDSATLTENAALIHDDVVAQTKGFVKYYDILEQKEGDGIFTTRIKAEVSMEKIWESDSMQLLLKRMGAPRFVIIAAEYHEGRPAAGSFALQKVTELLVARGFNLVKAFDTANLSIRQIETALSNERAAAEIGKKAGAEVIVLVNSSGAFESKAKSYGTTFELYNGHCEVKAVQVDSGQIVAAAVKTRKSGSIKKAIMSAAKDNAGDVVKQLLSAWSNYLNMGRTIQLVISGISVSQLTGIVEEIQALEGVAGVSQRNFAGKEALLEIKSKHKAMYLAESIENLPGFKLEITNFSADKIVVRKKN